MGRRVHGWSAAVLAFALLFLPASRGRISRIPSIGALTQAAPVIVVGEVLKVEQRGVGELTAEDGQHYPAKRMAATVRVDEVPKGDVAGQVLQVDYLQNPDWERGPLTNSLAERTYGMMFLQVTADKYGFAASESSSMPMSRNRAALPQPPGPDVYTRVLQHLAEALFSTEDTSLDRVLAISIITHEASPFVTELFRSALDGPAAASDPNLRLYLLAALVSRKDTSVVPVLEAALFSIQGPRYVNARQNMILALQQIDAATAAPILVRALKLPESELRMYAAMALKQTPGDVAIDGLLAAIDDPDPNAQFQVIEALSYLLHQPFCLSSEIPCASRRACLDHWREFAATRKSTDH
jgi:hypothetical protein